MKLYRVAKPASNNYNLLKTLTQITVFWSVFLAVLPYGIVSWFAPLFPWEIAFPKGLAMLLFVACSVIGLWSGYTMSQYGQGTPLPIDTARKLVLVGPYRYIRNPMAVAGIGQGIAVGLWLGSAWVVLYAFAGALLWHIIVRPSEERDLSQRFGADYVTYKANVKCWWWTFPKE